MLRRGPFRADEFVRDATLMRSATDRLLAPMTNIRRSAAGRTLRSAYTGPGTQGDDGNIFCAAAVGGVHELHP